MKKNRIMKCILNEERVSKLVFNEKNEVLTQLLKLKKKENKITVFFSKVKNCI